MGTRFGSKCAREQSLHLWVGWVSWLIAWFPKLKLGSSNASRWKYVDDKPRPPTKKPNYLKDVRDQQWHMKQRSTKWDHDSFDGGRLKGGHNPYHATRPTLLSALAKRQLQTITSSTSDYTKTACIHATLDLAQHRHILQLW